MFISSSFFFLKETEYIIKIVKRYVGKVILLPTSDPTVPNVSLPKDYLLIGSLSFQRKLILMHFKHFFSITRSKTYTSHHNPLYNYITVTKWHKTIFTFTIYDIEKHNKEYQIWFHQYLNKTLKKPKWNMQAWKNTHYKSLNWFCNLQMVATQFVFTVCTSVYWHNWLFKKTQIVEYYTDCSAFCLLH